MSELFGNIICLICNDKISVCKEYNVKRHYALKHESEYQTFNEERKKRKLKNCQRQLGHNKLVFKNMLLKLEHVQKLAAL